MNRADYEGRRRLACDLYLAFETDADHFTAQLFRLMHKADEMNKGLLGKGFPVALNIFREWEDAPSPRAFFVRYNLTAVLHGQPYTDYLLKYGLPLEDHDERPEEP